MAKLRVWEHEKGISYSFRCPACQITHGFVVSTDAMLRGWDFNGDIERPTVWPDISGACPRRDSDGRFIYEPPWVHCHLFLRDGILEFWPDCSHALAGQSVPLPDIPDGQA